MRIRLLALSLDPAPLMQRPGCRVLLQSFRWLPSTSPPGLSPCAPPQICCPSAGSALHSLMDVELLELLSPSAEGRHLLPEGHCGQCMLRPQPALDPRTLLRAAALTHCDTPAGRTFQHQPLICAPAADWFGSQEVSSKLPQTLPHVMSLSFVACIWTVDMLSIGYLFYYDAKPPPPPANLHSLWWIVCGPCSQAILEF